MLPTPSTSHVPYSRVYEPAEDSFLFLDTLASPSEVEFLTARFGVASASRARTGRRPQPPPPQPLPPLVVEIGTGSGVVVAFVTAQARHIFGRPDVLTAGVDVNVFACAATAETVRRAVAKEKSSSPSPSSSPSSSGGGAETGMYLGSTAADLVSALRPGSVDVLLFNPPYVPTPEMPRHDHPVVLSVAAPSSPGRGGVSEEGETGGHAEGSSEDDDEEGGGRGRSAADEQFVRDSYLLELSYAGGMHGMETTSRLIASLPRVLSQRGCAYVLLCAQNRPDEVVQREIMGLGPEWRAVIAGMSGKKAGWERLQILRIWRDEEGLVFPEAGGE